MNTNNSQRSSSLYEIHCGQFDIQHVGKVLKGGTYAILSDCSEVLITANRERDNILLSANQERDNIISRARQEAKAIIDEAKKTKKSEEQRGYSDGFEVGKQENANMMMEFVAKSANSFSKLENDVTDVVKVALRKIIGKLDKNELIVNVVKTSLQKIKMQKQATLKVATTDAQMLRDRVAELTQDTPVLEFLDITGDNHLSSGSCVLETELGVIDASIEIQLNAIESALSKFKS